MASQTKLTEGMAVKDVDGEKLGRIISLGEEVFVVERGFFFREDLAPRYDQVLEVRDGEVLLSIRRECVGSSRVDLQACKLEYSIVSPK